MLRLSMLLRAALPCAGAFAQTYPVKPIRVLIPASLRDSGDALSRLGGRKVDQERGQRLPNWGKPARDIGFQPR